MPSATHEKEKEQIKSAYTEFTTKNKALWTSMNSIGVILSVVLGGLTFWITYAEQYDCGTPGLKMPLYMVFVMHVLNFFEFILNLTGLEKYLCNFWTGCFFFGYEITVLVFMQVVYFDPKALYCITQAPWLYYTLMFNIFVFYFLVVFSICFFFRKFGAERAAMEEPKYAD